MRELNASQAARIIDSYPQEVAATGGRPRPRQRPSAPIIGAVLLAVGAALLSSGGATNGVVFAGFGGILMLVGTAVAAGVHIGGDEGADSSTGNLRKALSMSVATDCLCCRKMGHDIPTSPDAVWDALRDGTEAVNDGP